MKAATSPPAVAAAAAAAAMSSSPWPGAPALLFASPATAGSGPGAGGSAFAETAATLGPQSSSPVHSEMAGSSLFLLFS